MIKKKILHLILKFKWFDQIESGQKTVEFRKATEYWRKRLVGKHYDEIWLYRGYTKKILKRKWRCIAKETVLHKEFGVEPVECFIIDVSGEII